MEPEFRGNTIRLGKELSELDLLVLRFVEILEKTEIDYVIISGYVAILFGRSRNTEDVDLFIGKMDFAKFMNFWQDAEKEGFECINTPDPKTAYENYLHEMLSLRFAINGTWEPNFELKFPKTDLNQYSLKNKLNVEINGKTIITSKMELQVAFKLYLGSDKDIEDAIHLWEIFKGRLNMEVFNGFVKRLHVEDRVKELK